MYLHLTIKIAPKTLKSSIRRRFGLANLKNKTILIKAVKKNKCASVL